MARCEGNNHVILLEPEPVANVTCVNEHLPVKVWDQGQPCRFHYECECEQALGMGGHTVGSGCGWGIGGKLDSTRACSPDLQALSPWGGLRMQVWHRDQGRTKVQAGCSEGLISWGPNNQFPLLSAQDTEVNDPKQGLKTQTLRILRPRGWIQAGQVWGGSFLSFSVWGFQVFLGL